MRHALGLVLVSTAGVAMASTCKVQSPAHRVALVELYTSQGCSSCPPADRWLSALPRRYAPTQAVALALHVGYWDYIGWKDPYAKREFNQRQRDWASANHNRTVYTPGVFVQGREEPDWATEARIERHVKASNATPAGANISLTGGAEGQQLRLEVSAQAVPAHPNAELRVALVQSGLKTAVKAGENRGEQLSNDHVVREWSAALPLRTHRLTYTLPAGSPPSAWAVVAFVQAGSGQEILQALRWAPQACPG